MGCEENYGYKSVIKLVVQLIKVLIKVLFPKRLNQYNFQMCSSIKHLLHYL